MKFKFTVLEGERVKLVPMQVEHVEGLFEAASDDRVWTYMPMEVKTIDDINLLVTDALSSRERGQEYPFTILDKETEKVVGSSRFLNISAENRRLEIGWTWYNPSVWRTSVNTECKYLLLGHCFEDLAMLRVEFKTHEGNIRSQHAIERLGAIKEGVLRNHRISPQGEVADSHLYSVLLEEWPRMKRSLQNYLKV